MFGENSKIVGHSLMRSHKANKWQLMIVSPHQMLGENSWDFWHDISVISRKYDISCLTWSEYATIEINLLKRHKLVFRYYVPRCEGLIGGDHEPIVSVLNMDVWDREKRSGANKSLLKIYTYL